jgi:polyisoprenoid-binding protein YceI
VSAALLLISPALTAQPSAPPRPIPGAPDTTRISGGAYTADAGHTLVGWRVSHFGFNDYFGQFGNISGTLTLDRARPANSALDITIPMSGISTASTGLTAHLQRADFFDAANHPTARFVSTRIVPRGNNATITGNLTIRGQTHPVTLNARFVGAGANPMNRRETVGFHATARINRSQWGIAYAVPLVSDAVQLDISAAFERAVQ